ncbi:hypothetical protein HDV05_001622 [Chytridiales sp. JEL 0842]|nr:hypothetical protein HDV05_001622 [Chytridiales sp. JEL 0842]
MAYMARERDAQRGDPRDNGDASYSSRVEGRSRPDRGEDRRNNNYAPPRADRRDLTPNNNNNSNNNNNNKAGDAINNLLAEIDSLDLGPANTNKPLPAATVAELPNGIKVSVRGASRNNPMTAGGARSERGERGERERGAVPPPKLERGGVDRSQTVMTAATSSTSRTGGYRDRGGDRDQQRGDLREREYGYGDRNDAPSNSSSSRPVARSPLDAPPPSSQRLEPTTPLRPDARQPPQIGRRDSVRSVDSEETEKNGLTLPRSNERAGQLNVPPQLQVPRSDRGDRENGASTPSSLPGNANNSSNNNISNGPLNSPSTVRSRSRDRVLVADLDSPSVSSERSRNNNNMFPRDKSEETLASSVTYTNTASNYGGGGVPMTSRSKSRDATTPTTPNSRLGTADRNAESPRSQFGLYPRAGAPAAPSNGGIDDDTASSVGRKRAGSESTAAGPNLSDMDPSTVASLLSDALLESRPYRIMQPEKFEERKKEMAVLASQVSSLQNRLTLESRIRDAALNLVKTGGDKNGGGGSRGAQEQLASANRKVDAIATDLWKVTAKLMEVERSVLKHTGGVMRATIINNEMESKMNRYNNVADPSASSSDQAKLASAELKLREFEKEVGVLKATTSRLESESLDASKKAEEATDELSKSKRLLRELQEEIRTLKSLGSGRSSTEVNKLKLELATTRADMAGLQEELLTAKDNLSKAQAQLEEDLNNMEEKDRMISNLMSELEEVTNKLDWKTAAETMSPTTSPSNVERQLRAQVAALEFQLREARQVPTGALGKSSESKSTPTRSNSAVIREQVTKQVSLQTENLKSMLGLQLKEAVLEKEKVKSDLSVERTKVRDLELELESLRGGGGGGTGSKQKKRGGYSHKGGSDTETEDGTMSTKAKDAGPRTPKGANSNGLNDRDLQQLQRLWIEIPSLSTAGRLTSPRSPPLSPGRFDDRNDAGGFQMDKFVSKVTSLVTNWKDLQVRLEILEGDLRLAKESEKGAQDFEIRERELKSEIRSLKEKTKNAAQEFETQERDLKSEIRNLKRANEELESELENALKRSRDLENQHMMGSTSAAKTLEEVRAKHSREIEDLIDKYERKLKELDRDLQIEFNVQFSEVDRKLKEAVRQRDEFELKLADLESTFRSQAEEIERQHRNEVDDLAAIHKRDLADALNQERSRMERVQKDSEMEIEDLKDRIQSVKKRAEADIEASVKQACEQLEEEYRMKFKEMETSHRSRLEEEKAAARIEIEKCQNLYKDELEKQRDQLLKEKRNELDDLRNQFELEAKAIENELSMRTANEMEALKAKLTAANELMQTKHEGELRRLKEDHENDLQQMQARLARSEAALMTSKSQFFEDRENLQEQIDRLENQLQLAKQAEQETNATHSAKIQDFESSIAKLQTELSNSQADLRRFQEDLTRKDREMRDADEKHKLQLSTIQKDYETRLKELEKHLADFDAVREELESVERDYMSELSKHDSEKMRSERALSEAKDAQNQLKQQLESLQRKLDQAQREVIEARSAAPRADPAAQKALQAELDRMQEVVIQLKSAKNDLLEELDNQGLRLHDAQREASILRKENEKLSRNVGDWDAERKRYETIMTGQREEISSLQTRYQELSIDRLGNKAGEEPPSTQKLRSEFRKLVTDLRQEYSAQINREITIRDQVEAQLKAANKQRELDIYNREDAGIQTQLKWVTGEQPQTLREKFLELKEANAFIESTEFSGNFFIRPPSIADLEKRLRGRGTETEESLAKRIGAAEAELAYAETGAHDSVIVNEVEEEAFKNLDEYIVTTWPQILSAPTATAGSETVETEAPPKAAPAEPAESAEPAEPAEPAAPIAETQATTTEETAKPVPEPVVDTPAAKPVTTAPPAAAPPAAAAEPKKEAEKRAGEKKSKACSIL